LTAKSKRPRVEDENGKGEEGRLKKKERASKGEVMTRVLISFRTKGRRWGGRARALFSGGKE